MTVNSVLDSILLTERIFRNLITTSNYCKISLETVGWKNYTAGIFKNIYAKEYELIIRNRQYSFLLAEGKGCIQFYFSFDGNAIQKVKMAYYPYPVMVKESADDIESYLLDMDDELIGEYYFDLWNILSHQFELSINDEELKELVRISKLKGNDETPENLILGQFESKYEYTNSSHFRVDYDSKVTTHNKCEIQIGAINNIRIPMNKLITPFLFFDFIAKNVFPDKYKTIISKSNFNTNLTISKNQSFEINPFTEKNIFTNHT